MKRSIVIVAVAVAACGPAPKASETATQTSTVQISLPDEPAMPWTGAGADVIARHCAACHSPEMIATQPPLAPDKWQATIDKMRNVYHAPIDEADDAALIAALQATKHAQ